MKIDILSLNPLVCQKKINTLLGSVSFYWLKVTQNASAERIRLDCIIYAIWFSFQLSFLVTFLVFVLQTFQRGPAWLSGKVSDTYSRGPGFEPHWILGFFVGVSLGKTLQNPSLIMVKPRKEINNVSCRRDMTEKMLKAT